MTGYVDRTAVAVERKIFSSECDALIEIDVIADDTGLTDDYTCAVVDAEVFANLCTGVNVNARVGMSYLGDDARYDGHAEFKQGMSHAIVDHSLNDRVTEDDFSKIFDRGIVVEHCLDIGKQHALDFGKGLDETEDDGCGSRFSVFSLF